MTSAMVMSIYSFVDTIAVGQSEGPAGAAAMAVITPLYGVLIFLGIRIVGKASDQGTLEPTNKCRGEAKSLSVLLNNLKGFGLAKGKIRIAHCKNEGAAQELNGMILSELPQVNIQIHRCRGLCSYYAEKGGLLVGFERM